MGDPEKKDTQPQTPTRAPARSTEATAAAQAQQQQRGAELQAAAAQTDTGSLKAETLLTGFFNEAILPEAPPTPEEVKEIIEKYEAKINQLINQLFALLKSDQFDPADLANLIKFEEEFNNIPSEDRKIIVWILVGEPTEEELKAFEAKHVKDGKFSYQPFIEILSGQNQLNIQKTREARIAVAFLEKNTQYKVTISENNKRASQAALERLRRLPKAIEAQHEKMVLNKYKDKFAAYMNGPEPEAEKRKKLLDAIPETERHVVQRLLDSEPTKDDQEALLKEKFNGNKPSPKELYAILQNNNANFREKIVALSLLTNEDIQALAKDEIIPPENVEQLLAFREARDRAAENAPEIPDALKGVGIMGAIEKLIDLLTKLAGKISAALEKAFNKKGPETKERGFAKSPLGVDKDGEDKKFKLKREYVKGEGVAIEAAKGTQIFAVEGGKVTMNNNVVTITDEQNNVRIEYRNVEVAAGITGQTVEAGKLIGIAGEGEEVGLRAFVNNEEQDTNKLLARNIIQEAAPAAPEVAAAPTMPETTPTAAPTTAPVTPPNPPNVPAQSQTQTPAAPAASAAAATPAPKKPWWKFWG